MLTEQELYEVWHGADRLGWPFGPVVQLLMLTAQREGEVAAIRWSDVDLGTGIWTLTSERRPRPVARIWCRCRPRRLRILKAQPRLERATCFRAGSPMGRGRCAASPKPSAASTSSAA